MRDAWLAFKLPDLLLTTIFEYQLVLGLQKINFYVIGSPNDEKSGFGDPKETVWN